MSILVTDIISVRLKCQDVGARPTTAEKGLDVEIVAVSTSRKEQLQDPEIHRVECNSP